MRATGQSVPEVVTRHWIELLHLEEPVSPESNFFAEGGDSLTAVELVAAIGDDLGFEMPLDPLFFEGTLQALMDTATQLAAD